MILVDTGAWLALADRGDAYHARCREFFRGNREPLMTTYPVLVECVHLMFSRIGVTKTLAWLEALATQGVASEFGRGFAVRNLFNMIRFAEALPDEQIVSALRRQLT